MRGRISTSESSVDEFGNFFTQSIASWSEEIFQIMNPAMTSFVSGNGPSVTVRFDPENRTRAPQELGFSPVPSSMIPALINSSLNLSMAANISGSISPASDALDALAITMTFMTELLNVVDGNAMEVGLFSDFHQ